MKIMHITEALGGGVQSAIAQYTCLLADEQHFVLGRARPGEATRSFGASTEVMRFTGSMFHYLLGVRARVEQLEPDVVHLHSSWAGLARLTIPRRYPIVYSPHCFAFERKDLNPVARSAYWAAEWLLSLREQRLVAVSPHEAQLGKRLSGRQGIFYVPNAVEIPRSAHPPAGGRRHVVMVGRIGPQKDPDFFAAVAEEVSADVDFVWVGDGDPKSRSILENAGVRVTGWMTSEQTIAIVSSAALYLHTGAWEAGPISTMEAASVGTPVIARRIPSMDSIGYFTAPNSTSEVAKLVDNFFASDDLQRIVSDQTEAVFMSSTTSAARERLSSAYANPGSMPHRIATADALRNGD